MITLVCIHVCHTHTSYYTITGSNVVLCCFTHIDTSVTHTYCIQIHHHSPGWTVSHQCSDQMSRYIQTQHLFTVGDWAPRSYLHNRHECSYANKWQIYIFTYRRTTLFCSWTGLLHQKLDILWLIICYSSTIVYNINCYMPLCCRVITLLDNNFL